MAEAQRRFTELTGRPASEANTTDWGPNSSPTIAPVNNSSATPNGTVFGNPAPPPVLDTNSVPWRSSNSPNSASGVDPFKAPSSTYTIPNFKQDPVLNVDPSKSTSPLFAKPNYLFKRSQ